MLPLALLPVIANLAKTGYGAIQEGQQREEMRKERQKWGAQNEALFNTDYYSDYTKRADPQNVIRQMKDTMKKQNEVDQNTAVVTGATPEAVNAGKERRNRAMTNVYGNIAAMGSEFKDRTKGRYLQQKSALQGMEYDNMQQDAQSSNNLLYNGAKGMAGTDWAGILGGGVDNKNAGSNVKYDYTSPLKNLLDPTNETSLA